MCRVFMRRYDNHQVATATQAEKRLLHQAGDVVEILDDGVSGGVKGESSAKHYIMELPKVPAARLSDLLVRVTNLDSQEVALRLYNIDLVTLRTKLTVAERIAMDEGKVSLKGGESKLNKSKQLRPT